MHDIQIESELQSKLPELRLGILQCRVRVMEKQEALDRELERIVLKIQSAMTRDEVSGHPVISASRKAYKVLGKDPSRYRLSAEALLRRITGGKTLYRINNVVDLLNLISVQTGFSIGGYDADKIEGTARLSIGKASDEYQAIGRGLLNIEFLPTFRDELGAFGTPTSDSERTSVSTHTISFLMIIYDFDGKGELDEAMDLSSSYLKQFAQAEEVEGKIIEISH